MPVHLAFRLVASGAHGRTGRESVRDGATAVTAPTYGDHAEAVAAALQELVVVGDIPTADSDVEDLLSCREAVVEALQERLHVFGLSPGRRLLKYERLQALASLRHVDQQLGTLLDRVVYEMPRLLPESRDRRPSEVLGPRRADRTVELWRRTAVELLAGTHALATAEDRTWVTHRGAGWYVMRDLATVVECGVLLDQRLQQLGLLSQHDRTPDTGTVDEHRLIAAHVARVATWYATSSSPDEASPSITNKGRHIGGPVYLVTTPSDVIVAQRRLGSYLRPLANSGSAYNANPQIAAATARQIVTSQLFVTGLFAEVAAKHPRASALSTEFSAREELLESIQPRLRYLADVKKFEVDWHRRYQQLEITQALHAWLRNAKPLTFTSAQLLDLANATHEVTHNLATSLRRELLRDDSNLGMAHPIHQSRIVRVGRRSALDAALTDLVNVPAPTTPISEYTAPLQRAALRGTLDLTPTESRPPAPYPAAKRARSATTP